MYVSKHTIYAWKAKYRGMSVSEAQKVKQLRQQNAAEEARCGADTGHGHTAVGDPCRESSLLTLVNIMCYLLSQFPGLGQASRLG
jgi:hypothetical protein